MLAGGLGTRLRSRLGDLPKPLAPVNGRPFLEYILDQLTVAGLTEVVLSVGYHGDKIQAYFGDHYRTLSLSYSFESTPLGTGGALALALQKTGSSPALVLNGDSLLHIDYQALFDWFAFETCSVCMVIRQVANISRYGSVVVSQGRVVEFMEKGLEGSGYINAGVYIVQPNLFSQYHFEGNFSFETDFLQRYCREILPRAFVSSGYFIDIGTPEDYDRAQKECFS